MWGLHQKQTKGNLENRQKKSESKQKKRAIQCRRKKETGCGGPSILQVIAGSPLPQPTHPSIPAGCAHVSKPWPRSEPIRTASRCSLFQARRPVQAWAANVRCGLMLD